MKSVIFALLVCASSFAQVYQFECTAKLENTATNTVIKNETGKVSMEGDQCLPAFDFETFNFVFCFEEGANHMALHVNHLASGKTAEDSGPVHTERLTARLSGAEADVEASFVCEAKK